MEQTQSRLSSLPPEIRREIFLHVLAPGPKLHLSLRDGRPFVSPCLGADLGDEAFLARRPDGEDEPISEDGDVVWARRLGSPWANHYLCEEVQAGLHYPDHPAGQTRPYAFILLVCKQM